MPQYIPWCIRELAVRLYAPFGSNQLVHNECPEPPCSRPSHVNLSMFIQGGSSSRRNKPICLPSCALPMPSPPTVSSIHKLPQDSTALGPETRYCAGSVLWLALRSCGLVDRPPQASVRSSPIGTLPPSQTASTMYRLIALKLHAPFLARAIRLYMLFRDLVSIAFAGKTCLKFVYSVIKTKATCDYCLEYIPLRGTYCCE